MKLSAAQREDDLQEERDVQRDRLMANVPRSVNLPDNPSILAERGIGSLSTIGAR